MYMIEISESKKHKLSEHIENALHEMGKAMACVEQFGHDEYGNRRHPDMHHDDGDYGMRGRMSYRHDDDDWDDGDWDDDDMMGQRRGRRRRRDSMGRYR